MLGYHNHNFFCDGKESLDSYIQEAIYQGFRHFGFSSHAPFFFENKWSISNDNLTNYCFQIDFLTKKYAKEVRIFKSLEIDYAPGFIYSFDFFKEKYKLDYTIGSIHYVVEPKTHELLFIDGPREDFLKNLHRVFGGNINEAVKRYFAQTAEMILKEKPDIIGHIDKIIMNSSSLILKNGIYPEWYFNEVNQILKLVAEEGKILEFNLRGLYKNKWHTGFPDEIFLKKCAEMKMKIVISTDAHHPSEIGLQYESAMKKIKESGIQQLFEFE